MKNYLIKLASALSMAALALTLSMSTGADSLLVNGSFENGINAPTAGSRTISSNLPSQRRDIDGWLVDVGSIDWVGDTWPASDGQLSLDLGGDDTSTGAGSRGGIAQFLWLTEGRYKLSFDIAGNPEGGVSSGDAVKQLLVTIQNGSPAVQQTFLFDTSGTSTSDMGWVSKALFFSVPPHEDPQGIPYQFNFTHPVNTRFGPALDNVALAPVIACDGFAPPAGVNIFVRKPGRVVPLRMYLVDQDGWDVWDVAPPVLEVDYKPSYRDPPLDAVEITRRGYGSKGNMFRPTRNGWAFNLKIRHYAPGTYTLTVKPGSTDYAIHPTCITTLTVE